MYQVNRRTRLVLALTPFKAVPKEVQAQSSSQIQATMATSVHAVIRLERECDVVVMSDEVGKMVGSRIRGNAQLVR